MNNQRFTELLNLYLDEEISPEDLNDLMAETRRSDDRQKMFVDYCRIHKAYVLLGDSFEANQKRRSFKQMVYAIGGLAAAFALLGMAGRNLLPMINGGHSDAAIVQSSDPESGPVFFPEIASTNTISSRFLKVNQPAQLENVGLSLLGRPSRNEGAFQSDRLILRAEQSEFQFNAQSLFAEDLLELGALEIRDPFNAVDDFSAASASDFSRAAFFPSANEGMTLSRDSRSNLK